MYLPASPWLQQGGSLYSSRSSSSTDSWESSSSQGGSPPPREVPWGHGSRPRVTSSHGSVWDKQYYEDILGGDVDAWHGLEMELPGEKHDLLDRLVMEDQDEKMSRIRLHLKQYEGNIKQHQMLSSLEVENLLKLLQLQQSSSHAPEDRTNNQLQIAISTATGNDKKFNYTTCAPPPPPNFFLRKQNQTRKQDRSTPYSNAMQGVSNWFSPMSYTVSGPQQPPVTSSANLANLQGKNRTINTSPSPGSNMAVHLRVQESRWQFQALESERKKTEAAIAKENPGARISSSNTILIPRLPLYPTKLDKLLVDSLREQARVLTLLHRIETATISGTSEFANLLAMWKEKILVVMAIRRKERMSNVEISVQLVDSLASMSLACRKARTVLWGIMMKKVNK